ncbi:H-NS histone family protein [Nitrobacter winogradskyi]|uniref:H-NS histone family protein n=1 Tax=Nitrobacter winogradskyi TaxID=913 RepID=UPI001143DBD0|nr:H-NS histone family protein [Nitrobacter winogradskyi]
MTLDELWSLYEEIGGMLTDRIRAEKRELEKRLAVLHRGMASPEEQAGHEADPVAKRRRKYPRVLPKYRNPQSPSETWSGRGKLPRWLVIATKNGRRIEEFRIVDANVPLKRQRA